MTDPKIQGLDDLEVRVGQFDASRQVYPVTVTRADGSNYDGSLHLQGLRTPPEGSVSDLEAYGLDLFSRLFSDSLADAFDYAWAAARARQRGLRLRLWLHSDDVALHEIPWELLYYDDSGGLSPPMPLATSDRVAFSRYLASSEPWGEPIQRRPLRMLIVIAAPNDLGTAWADLAPIDKGMEQRYLKSVFSAMQASGQLDYHFLELATSDALHDGLERGCDVVLYFGHALHHARRGTRLVLEDATGASALYNGAELVQRLKQSTDRPRLVVLVACNTAAQRDDYPLGSLAAQLVQQAGVPAVLAMQRLVEITLARNFTHHLSEFLLQHGVIDVAMNSARRRIAEAGNLGWSTPVLYMRSRNGQLFSPNALLDYARAVLEDAQFVRWIKADFIHVEAISVPQGQHWALLKIRPEDAPPGADALETLKRALQLDHNQDDANLIALLGPPHSGQTTTLCRLAVDLANAARQSAQSHRTVGIYIPLAGYGQQRGSSRQLEQLIIETVSAKVPALASELQRLFQRRGSISTGTQETPRYVFLFDSLDAIAENQRPMASREIVDLARELPDQRVIVSCTQYHFPGPLFEHARIVLLQPLNERQVMRYLRQRNPRRCNLLFRRIAENRLLDLATDPSLLTLIYQRLENEQSATFTRNQLIQDLLDQALSDIGPRYTQGDAARETLIALAWEMRWQHKETLSLREVFALMAHVRRERDYNLEYLYQKFREVRLLVDAGNHRVRFAHPALQSYCAALALYARPDFKERLEDIIAMCGISGRLFWWEGVLYSLAGLLKEAAPLSPLGAAAFADNSSSHTLLVARCLEALSADAEQSMSEQVRQELLDACAVRLRVDREPSAERRAQIATALGRLAYPQTIRELRRLLTERVRLTPGGPRYDYSNVRIAAARALRTLVTRFQNRMQAAAQTNKSVDAPASGPALNPEAQRCSQAVSLEEELMGPESALLRQLQAWSNGADGRAEVQQAGRAKLRTTLDSDASSTLERTIAAFALGDLAVDEADAALLLDMVMRQPPAAMPPDEWDDIAWSAADALTLFDAEQVTSLLAERFQQDTPLDHCIRQVAHIAGRMRVRDEAVIKWLVKLLLHNPDHFIKARALRALALLGKGLPSFAWLGEVLQSLNYIAVDVHLDPLVLQVVTDIAVWNITALTPLGSFNAQAQDNLSTIYLRRKAIEALAWIGDQNTLDELYAQVPNWPLELREAWYISAAAIKARLTSRSDS